MHTENDVRSSEWISMDRGLSRREHNRMVPAANNNNFNLLVSYYKLKRAAASILKKVPPR
jgi:hypothetical protein